MKYIIALILGVWNVSGASAQSVTGIEKTPELNNGFYLHGEHHYQESSADLMEVFTKYYIEERNVHNIILETGYVESILINEYLESGDESIICSVYNTGWLPSSMYFLRHLRTLHLKHNIKILGIDQFSSFTSWFTFMSGVLKPLNNLEFSNNDKALITEIHTINDSVNQLGYEEFHDVFDIGKLYQIKQTFKTMFENDKSFYKTHLSKQDYTDVLIILETDLALSKEMKVRDKNTNKRWLNQLNLFIKHKKVLEGNYFGQFGIMHILHNKNSFSWLLNKSSESVFKGNVSLVHNRYINSITYKQVSVDEVQFTNEKKCTRSFPLRMFRHFPSPNLKKRRRKRLP